MNSRLENMYEKDLGRFRRIDDNIDNKDTNDTSQNSNNKRGTDKN